MSVMSHLRELLKTSWFLPLVVADTILIFTLGLCLGLQIGFAKGRQASQPQVEQR